MTEIQLSNHNLQIAAHVGADRNVVGIKKKHLYGADNTTGWQAHCDGACGEMALAKYLDVFWDGNMKNFKAADVGALQVRTTTHAGGCLLLHERDKDEDITVLVLAHKTPVFVLAGWIYGHEGKLKQYWRDPVKGRPAYFVPQSALHDMATLPTGRTQQ